MSDVYGYGLQLPPTRARVSNWVLLFGKIIHLVGMLSPFWAVVGKVHMGIWLECGPKGCSSRSHGDMYPQWLRAVQAMTILGVIVSLFGVITTVVYLRTSNKSLLTVGALSAIAAGILVMIGVIIYGSYSPFDLYWAFYIEVVAGVIMLLAGTGLFTQVCRRQ